VDLHNKTYKYAHPSFYIMSKSIIATCPECNHEFLFKTEAKRPRPHCPKCKHWFYIKKSVAPGTQKEKIIKLSQSSFIPPEENMAFIDDPDELLMSVAIRELNKQNPDPRWASILINCKKENITTKTEVIEQLQKLPTKNLTEMLKKQHIRSWQQE
jgi:hypothetical protein